jgi:hypothetical protein
MVDWHKIHLYMESGHLDYFYGPAYLLLGSTAGFRAYQSKTETLVRTATPCFKR